jgi:hypothetical protein
MPAQTVVKTEPGVKQNLADVVCRKCQKKGHYANRCPENAQVRRARVQPELDNTPPDDSLFENLIGTTPEPGNFTYRSIRAIYTDDRPDEFKIPVLINGH